MEVWRTWSSGDQKKEILVARTVKLSRKALKSVKPTSGREIAANERSKQGRRLQGELRHSYLEAGVCSEPFLKVSLYSEHQTEKVMMWSLGYIKSGGMETFWDRTHHWKKKKKRWHKICSYQPSQLVQLYSVWLICILVLCFDFHVHLLLQLFSLHGLFLGQPTSSVALLSYTEKLRTKRNLFFFLRLQSGFHFHVVIWENFLY